MFMAVRLTWRNIYPSEKFIGQVLQTVMKHMLHIQYIVAYLPKARSVEPNRHIAR
jgi:hypothetical protein